MIPRDFEIELNQVRPTQSTVGYEEVEMKRREWRARSQQEKARHLNRHWFPIVRGPERSSYLLDGHHLACALQQEGVAVVNARLVDDLSDPPLDMFRRAMEQRGYINPFDRRLWMAGTLPRRLADLGDDPFRSLVAKVRRRNNCPKIREPFAEFRWANFLRGHIEPDTLAKSPEKAMTMARRLIWENFCCREFLGCRCFQAA